MITRFAPSPTGPLHLGHAFSALTAFEMAQQAGGTFLLRIEDTDRARAKPEWEDQIYDDLTWLGLTWPNPVLRQSGRRAAHMDAIDRLAARGLVFPCSCRRADIRAALSAPQEGGALPAGPDGLIYPGTCRGREMGTRRPGDALRIDMRKAIQSLDKPVTFEECLAPNAGLHDTMPCDMIGTVGDIVLGRRETGDIAYHLAVVVDDAHQRVTDVVRGADLYGATPLHVLLQHLLGLPTPRYHHHRLIRDGDGKRLAKRADSRALRTYRDNGATAADIRRMVGLA